MNKKNIKEKAKCCSCGGSLKGGFVMVALMKKATWQHPIWKNRLLSEGPLAAAILCETCVKAGKRPAKAIEWDTKTLEIKYHPVDTLEPIPQEAFEKLPRKPQVGG